MSSALMENYNVIDAVTSRSREARANAFYLFFEDFVESAKVFGVFIKDIAQL